MSAADVNDGELVERKDDPDRDPERRRWVYALLILVILLLLTCCCWVWSLRAPVPDVVGMTQKQAHATLKKAGFNSDFISEATGMPVSGSAADDGAVAVSQSPEAGKKYIRGTTVTVTMSSKPAPPFTPQSDGSNITLPDGSGSSGSQPSGPSAVTGLGGSTAVSAGPLVPSALNMKPSAAKAVLSAAGYRAVIGGYHSASAGVLAGNVWYQNPAPGTSAPRGSTVVLWLSTGAPKGGFADEPYPAPIK